MSNEPPRNPWHHRFEPDEFKAYYEQKLERLEQECKLDGCDETTQWPRDYCSNQHMNEGLRQAAEKLQELLEE
jgi:hypothetical protein